MTNTQKGLLLTGVAAVCFSAKAIFIKMAYAIYPVSAIDLLHLRFSYALPIYAILGLQMWRKKKLVHISKKDCWQIAGLSFLGYYLASWFDFQGLKYISAGIERIILFTYPTFVVLFSYLFFRKKISLLTVLSLLITYAGILLIAKNPQVYQAAGFLTGGSFILLSAVTFALFLVFGGEKIRQIGSSNFNVITMIFSSIYVIIHYNIFNQNQFFNLPLSIHFYGIALALVCTVIPSFLSAEGIRLLGANKAAIVAGVGPVSTLFLAYVFLQETLSTPEIIGSALV